MKRKHANDSATQMNKRPSLREANSVYDEAEQYRIATVRFPINALTSKWSSGANRPISKTHKRRLCQIFKEVGVLRRDPDHRLQIACSRAHVEQMLEHLGQKRNEVGGAAGTREKSPDTDADYPSFEDWSSVVGEQEKAELIAGQHRLEALKELLETSGAQHAERWWVCNVYDRDAVPPRLHVKLRANREGTTLPDNHGQIWAELATLSSNDGNLFKDSNKVVEQQMLEHLGLSSRVKFPVRRLATLWKNERWNQMITRWCRFPMGQSLFTLSTFEWMASCRIDDYWFAAFDQVIQAASTLHGRFGLDIDVPDWNQLASLPATRSQTDVQGLFYPELAPEELPQPSSDRPRNSLPALRDEAYHDLHRSVALDPAYRFFDIQALLNTTKRGKDHERCDVPRRAVAKPEAYPSCRS
ncbi:hypothetical protein DPSP01_014501 [Paraphaeosphaeria sporulosa]